MPATIFTERLILRSFKRTDIADFYEYAKSPYVGPNAGWAPHKSVFETHMVLDMFMDNDDTWAIVYKDDMKVIGSISLHTDLFRAFLKNPKIKCLGFALSHDYWGMGIATEAVMAIQHYAFEHMHLEILTVDHYPQNTRSQRVIEKCGFTKEGVMRKCRYSYDNELVDLVCYSMLKSEWEQIRLQRKIEQKKNVKCKIDLSPL